MISCRASSSGFLANTTARHFSSQSRQQAHLIPLFLKMRAIHDLVPFSETYSRHQFKKFFTDVITTARSTPPVETPRLVQLIEEKKDAVLRKTMAIESREWALTYAENEKEKKPDCFSSDEQHLYTLKEGIKPSDGLRAFLKGPTNTDCGGAVEAIFLKTIAEVIGEEKFNILFSHPSLRLRFQRGGALTPTSLLQLFTEPVHTNFSSSDRSHITCGTRLYFQGIPWYGIKHPTGIGHGHHVIHTGTLSNGAPLYWAFNFQKPVTEEEIQYFLLDAYNKTRSEEDSQLVRSLTPDMFKEWMKAVHSSKLRNLDAAIDHCYDNPDEPYTMEKALNVGLGFFGYVFADKTSPDTLLLITEAPLELLKSPDFPAALSFLQALKVGHLALKLLQSAEEPISVTSKEAKNFEKWSKSSIDIATFF